MKEKRFNKYVEAICEAFNVSNYDIFAKSKIPEHVDPRQMLYYICMGNGFKYSEIRRVMLKNGYKIDNTSIRFGVHSMTKKIKNDRDYKNLVEQLNEI
jgi:chromosomal replication initiation ATPase DnaA